MSKLIITRWNGRVLTLTAQGQEVVQIDVEEANGQSILGNIYVGKVKNIVKNINAAFVEIGDGQMGYYSLAENPRHHFASPRGSRKLCEGDEIIVQVERDAVKTKAPVLTGNLSFTGKYCVLTAGKNTIGFSAKITDDSWKRRLRPLLEEKQDADFGIIVRTNASEAPLEALLEELEQLKANYRKLLSEAPYRTSRSLLCPAPPAYIKGIRDCFSPSLEEIVTDDREIMDSLKAYLDSWQPEDAGKLVFYEDSLLPLSKLYSVDTVMARAGKKQAWLKSGGYLVIEPTEALTVIDVNTGKYSGKKNARDTILKINLEAAAESAFQMRLRNLSGIIVIDFIDMESEEDKRRIMDELSRLLAADPVKAAVVDMTKLGLVEVTRKKIRKPLHEQLEFQQ